MKQKKENQRSLFELGIPITLPSVIFIILAIYIMICVFIYARSNPINGYAVKEGSLSVSKVYRGIVLREEEIISATSSGYVNYYAREGEKISVGDLIYSIDSNGTLTEMIQSDTMGENTLSDNDLSNIRNEIVDFSKDFDSNHFDSVYDFKYDLQGTTIKLSNLNILNSIDSLNTGLSSSGIKLNHSPKSGYVVYSIDGYEDMILDDITKDTLNEDDYEKKQLVNAELIATGDPVYKYITDEYWSIVIPVSSDKGQELLEEEYVKIRFLKNQEVSNAKVSIHTSADDTFCVLTLHDSVLKFCTERFIDIEIITEDERGLKIPTSAIVEKEFFLIPKSFMTTEADEKGNYKFLKETYLENGTVSSEVIELTVYNETDTDYYISDPQLRIGDNLIKSDSNEKYTISKKGTLTGVYNMNKGYADFRQIIILYQNEEYAIVKPNTTYGLTTYDYIVLDSSSVNEDDFVFE